MRFRGVAEARNIRLPALLSPGVFRSNNLSGNNRNWPPWLALPPLTIVGRDARGHSQEHVVRHAHDQDRTKGTKVFRVQGKIGTVDGWCRVRLKLLHGVGRGKEGGWREGGDGGEIGLREYSFFLLRRRRRRRVTCTGSVGTRVVAFTRCSSITRSFNFTPVNLRLRYRLDIAAYRCILAREVNFSSRTVPRQVRKGRGKTLRVVNRERVLLSAGKERSVVFLKKESGFFTNGCLYPFFPEFTRRSAACQPRAVESVSRAEIVAVIKPAPRTTSSFRANMFFSRKCTYVNEVQP